MEQEKVIHLSSDAVRGILLEKSRHPGTECLVAMAGVRKGDDFYFDMVADSGIHATYEYAWCEKDHEYVEHLCNRHSEYYDVPKEELTVSMLHHHPPGCHSFSSTDKKSNNFLADKYGGVVVGLMWVEPKFHLKFWYVDEAGTEHPTKVILDDEGVRAAMPKKDLKNLRYQIEKNENPELFPSRPREEFPTFAELFRFGRRKKEPTGQTQDLLEAFPEFKEEILEISMNQQVHAHRQKDGGLLLHTNDANGDELYFKAVEEARELTIVAEGKHFKYQEGLIKNLIVLEEPEEDFTVEELRGKYAMYMVYIPNEYKEAHYEGPLYGYFHEESRTFNVVPEEVYSKRADTIFLGCLRNEHDLDVQDVEEGKFICGFWKGNGELEIHISDLENPVQVDFYSFKEEAFSRNTKVVEADQMKRKQAIILGNGSEGSFIAIELAKAGIGSLINIDNDKIKYHNISRHVCGIHDVGKFKVDAMEERLRDINPFCEIHSFRDEIQDIDPEFLKALIWEDSVIICCADNRHAAYICNQFADEYHIPMVAAGCGPRASTGEIFYYKPDCDMACYTCAFGEDRGVDYGNQQVRRQFYATEAELEKLHFQPGMSLDIDLTAIMATKLAIDLLMENEEEYEPKIMSYIGQGMLMVNYPIDNEVNPVMRAFEGADGKTAKPLQWKNVIVKKNSECEHCKNLVNDQQDAE